MGHRVQGWLLVNALAFRLLLHRDWLGNKLEQIASRCKQKADKTKTRVRAILLQQMTFGGVFSEAPPSGWYIEFFLANQSTENNRRSVGESTL